MGVKHGGGRMRKLITKCRRCGREMKRQGRYLMCECGNVKEIQP